MQESIDIMWMRMLKEPNLGNFWPYYFNELCVMENVSGSIYSSFIQGDRVLTQKLEKWEEYLQLDLSYSE